MALSCMTCQTIARRVEVQGTGSAKAPQPKEVLSIIQVGTTGYNQGSKFEVIGRLQYFFTEGYRNHWFILYENGTTAWLGDWAGSYSIFQQGVYSGKALISGYTVGGKVEISQVTLLVEVKDLIQEIFWEGEVPNHGLQEIGQAAVELYMTDGQMGLLHAVSSGKPMAYYGRYYALPQLQLQNVRAHHEWL
ncbi:hypothetical protein [Rufibacter sp. LB8]|uniref:hypothetical protein n=1 Tax=Rufibacter sp. LB8 TaxID=2777781 RepID=UPI00178C253C|nr:hypothetical protein [Rufibacter sp. LB8]